MADQESGPDELGSECPDDQNPLAEGGEDASIRLDHFLQICGVPTGGQAKQLIQEGLVHVNGAVETRRRKKLIPGDLVSIDGEEFEVTIE